MTKYMLIITEAGGGREIVLSTTARILVCFWLANLQILKKYWDTLNSSSIYTFCTKLSTLNRLWQSFNVVRLDHHHRQLPSLKVDFFQKYPKYLATVKPLFDLSCYDCCDDFHEHVAMYDTRFALDLMQIIIFNKKSSYLMRYSSL